MVKVWHGDEIKEVLQQYNNYVQALPGYSLEYTLYALNWILEQEDINFAGRPEAKQKDLDQICSKQGVSTPIERKGSQLAISLLCDIANETHPVEALLRANLDVQPRRRR